MRVSRERLSVCVCSSFSFGSKGGMWDLITLIPDHCLSIYLTFLYSTAWKFNPFSSGIIDLAWFTCCDFFES